MADTSPVSNRTWVSPIATIAFIAVAATGILMLLHVNLPAIRNLHHGIGVLFAAVGLLHLILNWKVLLSYFSKKVGVMAAVVALLVCIALSVFHGEDQREGGGPGGEGPGGGGPLVQMEGH